MSREGLVVRIPLHNDVRCPERCSPAALSVPARGRRWVGYLGLRAEVCSVVGHYGLGENVFPEISSQGKRQHNLPQTISTRKAPAGVVGWGQTRLRRNTRACPKSVSPLSYRRAPIYRGFDRLSNIRKTPSVPQRVLVAGRQEASFSSDHFVRHLGFATIHLQRRISPLGLVC